MNPPLVRRPCIRVGSAPTVGHAQVLAGNSSATRNDFCAEAATPNGSSEKWTLEREPERESRSTSP